MTREGLAEQEKVSFDRQPDLDTGLNRCGGERATFNACRRGGLSTEYRVEWEEKGMEPKMEMAEVEVFQCLPWTIASFSVDTTSIASAM